jgi:glycosyltransferase involved in cell wall biosynthesis
MKILQILPALEQGGVERGTIEIACALKNAGIENAVISSGGAMVKELDALGVKHFTIDAKSKNPITMHFNANKIAKIAKEGGFTLMHVRSRAPAWSVLKASKITGIPMLATYHGIYGTKPAVFKLPYNRVMLKGVGVIAVSNWVKRHIMETYGIDEDFITLIHRGADTSKFVPNAISKEKCDEFRASLGIDVGKTLITLPGRLTSWKGQEVLLEALSLMKSKDIACLLVGSDQGRKEYSSRLHEMAKALEDKVKVAFLEKTSNMPLVYASSDIVVSASSSQPEAFGRVIPEAQACGRLTVATAHGGACETIEDGVTGFLVPPGDAKALAIKLDEVIALPSNKKEEVRIRSVQSVRDNFSTQKMCESTINLYKKIHEV